MRWVSASHQVEIGARDLTRRRAGQLVHQHNFGAQRPHHARSLLRVPARHHGHEVIALDRADNGEPRARIAAGELHHGLSRTQLAAGLRIFDHPQGHAVLLRESGMQVVELDQQPPGQPSRQTCKLDDRRIADRAQHGVKRPVRPRAAHRKSPALGASELIRLPGRSHAVLRRDLGHRIEHACRKRDA